MKVKKIINVALASSLLFTSSCSTNNESKKTLENDNYKIENVITKSEIIIDEAVKEDESNTIRINSIFSDGAVLQRKSVVCLYGKTNDKWIAVKLMDKYYYGTIKNNEFEIYLPPFEAGGPYEMTLFTNTTKKTIHDIYFGEVFLCSGQSNMEFTMSASNKQKKDLENASYNEIRLFNIPHSTSLIERDTIGNVSWSEANSKTLANFTAVGYLIGRELHESLNVPIGLINASWGGSIVAFWMDKETYNDVSIEHNIFINTSETVFTPSIGYNAMINPIIRYKMRSVIFYQGESNANNTAKFYDVELSSLIESYRVRSNNPNLGFSIIELPRWGENTYWWAIIREKQQLVASTLNNVSISNNIDQGEFNDIHPQDKHVLASRTAMSILKTFFFADVNPYPVVKQIKKVNNKEIEIYFDSKVILKNGINGFEISKDDYDYITPKSYKFEKNILTLYSDENINYLRYGYSTEKLGDYDYLNDMSVQVSVYNEYDLPLDQFIRKID